MTFAFDKFFALLACFLGIFVMAGWLFAQNILTLYNPNSIFMVFNTALCLTLASAALLVPESRNSLRKYSQISAGLCITVLSGAVLLQYMTGTSSGIDQAFVAVQVKDYNPNPGRMAPQTAISYILCGIVLILLSKTHSLLVNLAIQAITLCVITISVVSLAGAFIRLELFYDWYKFSRMAVPTASGLFLLSIALWTSWYRLQARERGYLARLEKRISVTAILITIIIALTAGMSGFGILANRMEHTLEVSLINRHTDHAHLVQNEIEKAIISAVPLTNRLLMNRYLKMIAENQDHPLAESIITQDAESFLNEYSFAIAIYGHKNQLITQVGTPIEKPELAIPLTYRDQHIKATLLWKKGAILRVRMVIAPEGTVIGTAIVDITLPYLYTMLFEDDALGKTTENDICYALSDTMMSCLPNRSHSGTLTITRHNAQHIASPMDYALKKEKGLIVAPDHSNRQMIAAYGPIGELGIGLVIKVDTVEFYGPLRDRLQYAMILLIFLCGTGILVQRFQLLPLVAALVRSEREATLGKKQVEAIMESVADGIIMIDRNGTIHSFNPAICQMFGYNNAELSGQNIDILIPHSMREKHHQGMQRYLATGKSNIIGAGGIELPALRKDGNEFFIMLTMSEMWLEHERFFVGSLRDINDHKRLEKLKKEFISTVSHELRTPLTSIRGSLGLIYSGVTGELPEKAKGLIDIAYKNSERLVRLINDILDLEKIETGNMQFEIKPLRLGPLLHETIEANQSYGAQFDVTYKLINPLPEVEVLADSDRLIQVITNLLSNAAKFSPKGRDVIISVERLESYIRISVKDFGAGIPEEFQEHIFEKFAQADSSDAREKGGSGLGLSIAKSMIEQMNGRISFNTVMGESTTFHVDLIEKQQNVAPEGFTHGLPTLAKKERLLICEDDADVAKLLHMLMEQAGFAADIAYNLKEAKSLLYRPDAHYLAMTLDLILPDGDGITFLKEIRSNPLICQLPVIIVSAKATERRNALQGDAVGILDWLVKPIDTNRLINIVQSIGIIPSSEKPRILHIEDDPDILEVIKLNLAATAEIVPATTMSMAKKLLDKGNFSLIILDIELPDGSGTELLSWINERYLVPIPIIILSASEMSKTISEQVSAALVKSVASEERIINTIHYFLKDHLSKDTGAPL